MSSLPRISLPPVSSHVLLAFFLTLSLHFTSSLSKLLSGELCHPSGTPCKPPRQCVNVMDEQPCSMNVCSCFDAVASVCSSTNTTCPNGEACLRFKNPTLKSEFKHECVSCRLIVTKSVVGNLVQPGSCVTPTPIPQPSDMGYTYDSCTSSSECVTPRTCTSFSENERNFKNGDEKKCKEFGSMCYCHPPMLSLCQPGKACESKEEVCAESLTFFGPTCISKRLALDSTRWDVIVWDGIRALSSMTPTPTPFGLPVDARDDDVTGNDEDEPVATGSVLSDDDDGGMEEVVCIAQHHLKGIERQKLVYTQMRRATVLCDVDGSCATAGHIVLLNGKSMTMRRYCERVGCARRRMWVNSPRMRRGVRVGSLTHGLQFSALAARFEVGAEEQLLGLLVRLGF